MIVHIFNLRYHLYFATVALSRFRWPDDGTRIHTIQGVAAQEERSSTSRVIQKVHSHSAFLDIIHWRMGNVLD